MPFDNTVPAANIGLNQTIVPMQENFDAIQTAFDINHGSLTDIQGNAGKHTKVSFLEKAVNFIPLFGSYTLFGRKINLGGTDTLELIEIFRHNAQNIATSLTKAKFDANFGWTYLDSGFLVMVWGDFAINLVDQAQTITLNQVIGTDLPPIDNVIYAHAQLRSKTISTDPVDAVIYPRNYFIDPITNLIKIQITVRKRSAYNSSITASTLPLRGNYLLICNTSGGL